jgi:hypothetical protein
MKNDPKDLQIPLVLIVLGLIIYGIGGFNRTGTNGAAAQVSGVLMAAGIGTAVMIFAAFVTASLVGVSFGELGPAALKLAAIYIFPASIASLIPFGILLAFFIWLGLLMWLFELEVFQAVIFTIVLISVNLLVGMGLRAVLS